jgi:iron(III) transport system permease protein
MPILSIYRRMPTSLLALLVAAIAMGLAALWHFDPRVARLWLNTAQLAIGACIVAVPIGVVGAIAIFKTDAPGGRWASLVFVGMLFVPLYVVTGAWDAGFGIQGWQTLVTNQHLAHDPWLSGWRAAIWVHGVAGVSWVVLIVGSALRAVEAEIEEDAAMCASPAKVLLHVTLPRMAPAVAMAAVWVAIVAAMEISVTDFFQVRTFAEEVYTQAVLGTLDIGVEQGAGSEEPIAPQAPGSPPPVVTASGLWIGLLLSTMLAVAAIAVAGRLFNDLADVPHQAPWRWRLKKWRWPAGIVLWAIIFLVAVVPLGNFIYKAGGRVSATDAGLERSWSPPKVFERIAAAPSEFSGEIWLTARVGAAAATAAVLLAMPLAWSMRPNLARRGWDRAMATPQRSTSAVQYTKSYNDSLTFPWLRLLFLALCLTIPGPLLGIGLVHVLNHPPDSPLAPLTWLYDTNFAPWLVQTMRAWPLATLVLWPALASVPQATLDAAATDGTGPIGRLWRIALPQRWPAVVAAWLVSLAIAVGELAATIIVIPPQTSTMLSIRVFQLLHYGVDDRVAAICLVMVIGIATITGIAAQLLRRK